MFWNGQAHGLQPSRNFQNGNHTGTVRHYAISACDKNTYYFGSPLKLTGENFNNGVAGVTLAEPGDCLIGALVGTRYQPVREPGLVLCGGCAYVIVHDDPWTIFTMVSNKEIPVEHINMNFNFTPSVCVGDRLSPVTIDADSAGTDAALPLKVIRGIQAPWQNTDGTFHYEVLINCHAYKAGTPGIDSVPITEGPDCSAKVDCDGDGIPDAEDSAPNDPLVSGVDVDADGVDAAVDPDDNDPNVTGVDADGDGADAAVDADDNDPNVQ